MKSIKYITLIITILSLLFASCGNKSENAEAVEEGHEQHEEVHLTEQQFVALNMKIDTISTRNISGYVEASGTLSTPPQSRASVTSVVESNVVSIQVTEGDEVRKGQVLAYLSHPNIVKIQTDYLNAYSNSVFLQKKFERQRKLYEAGVGAGANFQKAESEYEAAKAEISGLEAQLKLLNVNVNAVRKGTIVQKVALQSPISGFVQKVSVNLGQYVSPQTEMFQVVNTEHIHADLMVFEKDAYKIKKGQEVIFEEEVVGGEKLVGEIHSVAKALEDNSKAIRVHVDVENKNHNLIPGVYVQGKILVTNEKTEALPQSAIIKEGDRFYVFSVEGENDEWAFKPVEVILGAKDGDWVAVQFPEYVEPNVQFAYNNAYYLISEMKKSEAGHSH